jgi:hypothetical protein
MAANGGSYSAAITEKAVAERMTQKMDMEWAIVRPVVLVNKPAKELYTTGPSARVAPLVPLSFDDCADCLLRAATDKPNWIGKIVNVVPDTGMSMSPAKSIGLMQTFANVLVEESPVGSLVDANRDRINGTSPSALLRSTSRVRRFRRSFRRLR